jgi:predicted  nucleic acid-binding Zn-ribbon protein
MSRKNAANERQFQVEIDKLRNTQAVAKSAAGSLDESIFLLEKDRTWLLERIKQLEKLNTQLLAEAAHAETSFMREQEAIRDMNDNFNVARTKLSSVATHANQVGKTHKDLTLRIEILEKIFRDEVKFFTSVFYLKILFLYCTTILYCYTRLLYFTTILSSYTLLLGKREAKR